MLLLPRQIGLGKSRKRLWYHASPSDGLMCFLLVVTRTLGILPMHSWMPLALSAAIWVSDFPNLMCKCGWETHNHVRVGPCMYDFDFTTGKRLQTITQIPSSELFRMLYLATLTWWFCHTLSFAFFFPISLFPFSHLQVVIILPNNRKERYDAIKKLCNVNSPGEVSELLL